MIFDEVHERNLPTDLGLALLLDARATLRPDLRVLAMSATPDTKGLLRCSAPTHRSPHSDGRMHPVDIVWAPMGKQDRVQEATAALVQRALREQTGDVLVFLPGIGEIRRVQRLLEASLPDRRRRVPAGRRAIAGRAGPRARAVAAPVGGGWCCPPTSPSRRSPSTACAWWSTPASPVCRASISAPA